MSPLPTTKTPPKQSITDLTVLLYGGAKIGKSTFCSQAPEALFLATEPGLNSLNVYQVPVTNWQTLLESCAEIAKGDHPFKTIVIDTVDNAYKMCAEYICKKFNVEHESDVDFGKGYAVINNEFQRVINKLGAMPYGLYLVSHSQTVEIKTRTGGKYNKTVPTLPEKARKIVLGLVDIILYCEIDGMPGPDGTTVMRRVIKTKPSAQYEAGDRTSRLPETIELSYAAFARAFERSAGPETDKTAKGK